MAGNSVIGALRVNLSVSSAQFDKGLKNATSKLQKFGKVASVAAAGVAAGVGAAMAAFNASANRMSELSKAARMAGVAADEMNRLGIAAQGFGFSQEQLSDALKDVNDKVGDFMTTGAGPLEDFFDNIGSKVGVTIKDFEGLNSSQALELYVNSLQKAGVSQQEMSFYMEALVNDGTLLYDMFKDNGKAIDEVNKKLNSVGYKPISDQVIKDSNAARTSMLQMGAAMKSVWDSQIIKIGPAIEQMMAAILESGIIEKLAEALVSVADTLSSWATSFKNLDPELQTFIATVGLVAAAAAPVLASLGAITLVLGPLLSALTMVSSAVIGLSAALWANPIGLAVAAIGAAAYLIYENWEPVKQWFSDMWTNVSSYFTGFGSFVKGVFTADMETAIEGLKLMWQGFTGFFEGIWTAVKGFFSAAWNDIIKPIMDRLGITEPIIAAWNAVKQTFIDVWDSIASKIEAVWAKIQPIIDKVKAGMSAISSASGDATVANANNRAGNSVPAYAKGTDYHPGGMALVGEEGPELVNLPRGAQVFTAGETKSLLSSKGGAAAAYNFSSNIGTQISAGLENGLSSTLDQAMTPMQTFTESLKSTVGDTLKGLVQGTLTLRDAFKNMLTKIADDLLNSGIDSLMNSIFGGGAGGGGGLFGSLFGSLFGGGDPLTGALRGAGLNAIPGFANGTNFAPGGLAMVGERGPELVNLSRGASVYNTQKTMSMLGSGGRSHVEIYLGEGLEGSILGKAESNAVRIVNGKMRGLDRNMNQRIADYQRDPDRRG